MIVQSTTRADFTAATELMSAFGPKAIKEATDRATQSRERGNVIRFCQWRQVARLIEMLADKDVQGTIH